MDLEQKFTEETDIEISLNVGILVLELEEDQQDQFFDKIYTINFPAYNANIAIAIDCCGDPIFMECSISREKNRYHVYDLIYITLDQYLDYFNAKMAI